MAVIKAKPEKFIQYVLPMVERELVTPLLTQRIPQDAFKGALGDTVSLRVGGMRAVARKYEFRTRTNPIVLDDIQGGGKITFKLDTHTTSATALTDEQMTLDEIDFAREVLQPQALAVAEDLEADVLAKWATIPWKRSFATTADADPLKVTAEARRVLNADKVAPQSGRFFLIGSDVEAAWLASDRLSKYDSTGETGTPALRDATIGRLAGSPVVVSQSLPADFCWYGHPSALAMANVAPVVPTGATAGRTAISANGFAVRWIQDYDPNYLRDRSVVSTFSGLTDIRDERDAKGDLKDPTGAGYATAKNVRGLAITMTGLGSVL